MTVAPTGAGALAAIEDSQRLGVERDDAAASATTSHATATAADDPAADPDALKLTVAADGPVLVAVADLAAAGWDIDALTPDQLRLQAGGQFIALRHIDTDADGDLSPDDRILFAGRAMAGEYTRENNYWLTYADADGPGGPRATTRDVTPPDRDPVTHTGPFTHTLRFERDTEYYLTMEPEEGPDRWMWGKPFAAPTVREETARIPNPAPDAGPARLRVMLHGYTDDPRVDPDHHAVVRLNGQRLAEVRFDGVGQHPVTATVPAGLIRPGDNRLQVETLGDTGATVDQIFLNWFALDYPAAYRATDDRLDFRPATEPASDGWLDVRAATDQASDGQLDIGPSLGPSEPAEPLGSTPTARLQRYVLTGFTSSDVHLLDVTDPAAPVALTGARVEPAGDGEYRVELVDEVPDDRRNAVRYVAFTPEAAVPYRVQRNHASELRSAHQGADWIAITHPDYLDAVAPLAEHRAKRGLRTAVVRIDDIYDEFSHGVFDPRAIRAFLAHAYHAWQRPAPTYVLLVGEANLDYRDGYGTGPRNDVPSMQVVMRHGGAATSDLWFAAVDGDDPLPDLQLGRISAASASQVRTVVEKTIAYEAVPHEAAWKKRAVMVADDDGASAFEPVSEALITLMPEDHTARRFYAARYPRDEDLTAAIRGAIDEGALAVNFVGHGNVDLWSPWPGGGRILQNADITKLENGERLPLLTAATCMNGWFSHPLKPTSLAEIWLRHPRGGGVAAWSPAGLAPLGPQAALLRTLYAGLYDGRGATLGALTNRAIADAYAENPGWWDTLSMFALLGDPALVVSGVAPTSGPTPTATPATTPEPGPTASPAPTVGPRPTPASVLYLPLGHTGR